MKIKNSWQDDPERPLLEHGPGGVVRQPHDRRDREAEPRPETRHRPEEGGAQDNGRREVQGPDGGRRHHHADENKVTVVSVTALKRLNFSLLHITAANSTSFIDKKIVPKTNFSKSRLM